MAEEQTAIAERDQENLSFPAKIRRGAGLVPEDWPDERVAAVAKMLPKNFRTTTNAIALFERAVPAGLNPLADEIWAWEQKGELQFMVSRDGWIKIANRDQQVTGLEFGHVYEEDEFHFEEKGDQEIEVHHKGGMVRGDLLGAYCVIHHEQGDHIERRLIGDFEHLQRKKVWKENEQEMLLTRVISTCVRLKCPEAAGLQAEGGMALDEKPKRGRAEKDAKEATDDELDALAAELEEAEQGGGREIEAEAKPADEGKAESDAGETSSTEGGDEPTTEPSSSTDEGEDVEMVVCDTCTKQVKKSAIGGHKGGHSRAGLKLPDEAERVIEEGDGFAFIDAGTGEVITAEEGPWGTWEEAVVAAQGLYEEDEDEGKGSEDTSSEPSESESSATSSDSSAEQADAFDEAAEEAEASEEAYEAPETPDGQPEESWDELYRDIMKLSSEHPDGLRWIREEATNLFADRGVETSDEGTVKTNNLDVMHLAELKNHLEEELQQAEF